MSTIIVNTAVDAVDPNDNATSLREALLIAAGSSDDDTIVFAEGVDHILLQDTPLFIRAGGGALRIEGDRDGDGDSDLTIATPNGSLWHFDVQGGATATLSRLYLGNNGTAPLPPEAGQAEGHGAQGASAYGSIRNHGNLTLVQTTIDGSWVYGGKGQQGGNGLDGSTYGADGWRGYEGGRGGDASIIHNRMGATLSIVDSTISYARVKGGEGGAGGRGGYGADGRADIDGGRGGSGGDGGNGGPGGLGAVIINEGTLTIVSGTISDANLHASQGGFLGNGGAGGEQDPRSILSPFGEDGDYGADVPAEIVANRWDGVATGAFADGIVFLQQAELSVPEGGGFTFSIRRSGDTSEALTLDWAVDLSLGTASADDIVGALSGEVTFAVGETWKYVIFNTVDDRRTEPSETFVLQLSNVESGSKQYTLGTSRGVATIEHVPLPVATFRDYDSNHIGSYDDLASFKAALAAVDQPLIVDIPVLDAGSLGKLSVSADAISFYAYGRTTGTIVLGEGVENSYLNGTASLNVAGNDIDNYIYGNDGANILSGGRGADLMAGKRGNDTYYVDNIGDVVIEQVGKGSDIVMTSRSWVMTVGSEIETLMTRGVSTNRIDLTGNEFAQRIIGNDGRNVISGGGGKDYLTGGGGADTFKFDIDPLGGDAPDFIFDFEKGVDRIALDASAFTAFSRNVAVKANEVSFTTDAKTADSHLIFKAATGQLLYDRDGAGGDAAVVFAVVKGVAALDASDFVIV